MPLTERDQRTLKIGGIVLGVLLVGFLLFNFVLGGEDELPPIPDTPPPTGIAEPDDGVVPTLAPSPVAVFTGRDPFSVPPVLSTASPVGPTSPGTSPTSPGTSPTSPGTSPTSPGTSPTSPGTSPPPTQPGNGSGTNVGGDSIVLLDVFTINGVDTVQVEVNGQVYNVSEGETFANGRYRLRSASGNCATFVRGDEAFTLCVRPGKS